MIQEAEQFVEALLKGDGDQAWNQVSHLSESGHSSIWLYENVFTSAMVQIGWLWEQNKITIADEYLATSTCHFILARYHYSIRKRFKNPNGKRIMLLCIDQEQHNLGIKMCAHLLEEHGWSTEILGASVSLEQMMQTANETKPDAIALSISIPYHVRKLKDYMEALDTLPSKPAIVIGGRLVSSYDLSSFLTERTTLLGSLSDLYVWHENERDGNDVN